MDADFWLRIAVAAMAIVAIWNAASPGMLLERLFEIADPSRHPKRQWWAKPVCICPPCMASLHGTWVWFLTGGDVNTCPLFVLVLSGVMVIVTRNLLSDG